MIYLYFRQAVSYLLIDNSRISSACDAFSWFDGFGIQMAPNQRPSISLL